MSDPTDDIRKALAGDNEAYARLFARVKPEVLRILTLELRHRGDAILEEAVQDVFIYLTEKLKIYDSQYTFETFARGLTRTVAKRHKARKSLGSPHTADGELAEELQYERIRVAGTREKHLLGFDRVRHSGAYAAPSPRFLHVLELLFSLGGYPHQQLAFAFNMLLFGKKKKSPGKQSGKGMPEVFGDPARVVEEIGPLTLHQAAVEFQRELQVTLGPTHDLTRLMKPLFTQMDKTGRDVFAKDNTSMRYLPHLKDQVLGQTQLLDYFGRNPRKSITDWSHMVRKRLKEAVGQGGKQ